MRFIESTRLGLFCFALFLQDIKVASYLILFLLKLSVV